MDFGYILFNTLIYGVVAFGFILFFAYAKYLNLSLGSMTVFSGFLLYYFFTYGITPLNIALTLGFLIVFFGSHFLIYKSFKNPFQRELFGLVFTLGLSIFIENFSGFFFGPNSVNILDNRIGVLPLFSLFVIINFLIIYVFKYSFLGRVFKGIYENSKVVSSLGLNVNKLILVGAMFFFLLLLLSSYGVIANSNVKATDGIFYLLKGLGIMIIVGVSAIEYTFLGALLYVLVEYILFVELGLPISYKETFILVIVLCILVFKPNGLFTFAKRKL